MFYSHQLLARKAALGQIWMAATLHSKINRKKLDKLNIIQICEEILNPSVPMALRLSGILMGGVVIVYERKVKLLYDDVNRLVVELNDVWKAKPVRDSSGLPKRKAKARYETVTLPKPENVDTEVEPTMPDSDATFAAARFQHMRLADLDEQYVHIEINDDDISENHHQAQAEDITLPDKFNSGFKETFHHDRFERFDMREEEILIDLTIPPEQEIPNLIPSPPRYDNAVPVDTTTMRSSPSHPPEPIWHDDAVPFNSTNNPQGGSPGQQDEPAQEVDLEKKPKAPKRRVARNNPSGPQIDNEQVMVASTVYQSWLRDTSDIVTKRRKVNQIPRSITLATLMELPPVAIITGYEKFPPSFYYPKPIVDLWKKSTRPKTPKRKSPSLGETQEQHEQNTTNSHDEEFYPRDHPEQPPEMFPDYAGQYNPNNSVERMRKNLEDLGLDAGRHSGYFTPSSPDSLDVLGANILDPRHYSGSARSSGSGPTMPVGESEMLPTGRSKRRQQSSLGGSHLETVEEEEPFVAAFKIRRVSEEGPTPETEPLMETGPTQTPLQGTSSDPPVDPLTLAIRSQLKVHFETPGAAKYESLGQLAHGMNASRAAKLFYQTCVLATRNYIKVEQEEPYGDIKISRGPKM